ncbi:MAG: TraB/VirB10 family protein [Candidatus Bathyarchaeia archaeon]
MKFLGNLTVKQKQRIKILLVVAAILAMIGILPGITGRDTGKKEQVLKKDRKFSLLTEKVEKDLWIAAEGQNIRALQKSVDDLQAEMKRFRDEMEQLKRKASVPPPPAETVRKRGRETEFPPVPPPPPDREKRDEREKREDLRTDEKRMRDQERKSSTIRIFREERSERTDRKTSKTRDSSIWVPTGSITRAVLLTGLDVPTSLGTRSEPHPILMVLSDYSILPNDFRMNLRECFVVGAGYGSMVEERAYIRTETLSCVKTDGTPWEVPLKGQVIGEDGKLGMRGKVVRKQGRQIALSIVSGVLGGFANAMRPQQTISLFQVEREEDRIKTLTPALGDVMLGAGLAGTSNALSRVAEYYLKLAEQMYPVIEIEAGRQVEIVIVKGGRLSPQEEKSKEKHEPKQEREVVKK